MGDSWLPILIAVLPIVGAAGTYAYQRKADRKSALVEIRRAAYRNYLNSFMAMSDTPEAMDDIRRKYYQAETELLVVGSDAVIQRVGALSRFYAITNHDRFNRDASEVRKLVAEVSRAMRDDCFEKTNLSIDDIKALVPIG